MSKKYDAVVYIGRFQPLHSAHIETLKRAAELGKRVIVIVGSAKRPRTYKNPFYFGEREAMLINAWKEYGLGNRYDTALNIEPNIDTLYDDNAWILRVQAIVAKHTVAGDKIAMIGHFKDNSSKYLKWFPQWTLEQMPAVEPLDATSVRDLYFRNNANLNFIASVVSPSTLAFLRGFTGGTEYAQVVREREFIDTYKKQYESLAYPPIFVTTDAVVIQGGHVLLITRRSEPGKGLLAFPGGFVNADNDASVEDAMLRELKEETKIAVPEKVLRGSITKTKVFDAISRSSRGRTITHAFMISLSDGEWNLPKVKGSDDAEKAQWVPLSNISSENMFEDHFDILQSFVSVVK